MRKDVNLSETVKDEADELNQELEVDSNNEVHDARRNERDVLLGEQGWQRLQMIVTTRESIGGGGGSGIRPPLKATGIHESDANPWVA